MYVPEFVAWVVVGLLVALGVATRLILRDSHKARDEARTAMERVRVDTVKMLKILHEAQRGASPDGGPAAGWDIFQGLIEDALHVPRGSIYMPLKALPDNEAGLDNDQP